MSTCVLLALLAGSLLPADSEWLIQSRRQQRAGDLAGAIATLEHARAGAAADTPEMAGIELALADVYYIRGEYPPAIERAKHALAVYERCYGPRHPKVAEALAAIGANYTAASDYGEGKWYLDRAIAMWRETGGAEDPVFARMLYQLAFTQMRFGDYAAAKLSADRSIAILEADQSPDKPGLGQAYRVLAHIVNEIGDSSGARRAQERALSLIEKEAGPESVQVGDLLVTMGNTARASGDIAAAGRYHERAAQVYEKRLGPKNTRVGGALDDLGQDLLGLGRMQEARAVFERALEIQKEALGPRSSWVGNLIQGLAKVAAADGNFKLSRELYEQNLDIWREQLGPTHPFTVASLTQLADALAHLGERQQAFATALEAARIRRENLALTVRTVEERQALRYASVGMTSLDTAMTLALNGGPADRSAAWDAIIRVRALVLDEMAARHQAVRRSGDAETARLAQDLAAARSDLGRLVVQGRGSLAQAGYDRRLETGRARMQATEQALAVHSASFRTEFEREHAGLSDIRPALVEGSALVAFCRFNRKDYSSAADRIAPSYAAFVMRAGEEAPHLVMLGAAERVEAAVRAWRAEVERERRSMGRNAAWNETQYRTAATALRRLVWDRAAPFLRDATRVYIVPDGALQFVNFVALPVDDKRYLVEAGPLLHTLSAERDLVGTPAPAHGGKLLAVGDPAFGTREPGERLTLAAATFRGRHSGCAEFTRTSFELLPGSAIETKALARIWRGQGWSAEVLTGGAATESAVKRMAPGSRVLHLATHGFFLDECSGAAVAMENPLLRSGLALAGANHRNDAHAGQEDGILTAEEAASLDLGDTEWVVLSGCDTGIGEIKAGEGVLGLRRAFQEAGARTVITSLWPVDDDEARSWMTRLYTARFVRHQPTAESIRATDLQALGARRAAGKSTHPFHWASFVAVGDWR